MAARGQPERGEQRRTGEDPAGVIRMQPHELPLLWPQRPWPLPGSGGDGDAAKVVEEPGAVNERRVDQAELFRRRPREPCHATRVAMEPRGLEVCGVAEAGECLVEGGVVAERALTPLFGLDRRRPEILGVRDGEEF